MKNKLLCTLLAFSAALFALNGATPRIYDAKMPRKIQIARNIAMMMARNGKVNFEIVYAPGAVPRYAANEAAAVLSKAFGVKITPRTKLSGKVPAIIIGDAKLAAKHGIDVTKFDRDGYAIRTIGNNILIVGQDDKGDPLKNVQGYGYMSRRGSLFGTYDFLERFAGVRFYFPGEMGTVIPPMKDWALPTINIYERPDFLQRNISCGNEASFKNLPANTRSLNFQRLRLSTIIIPNCHGLALLQFIQRFAKSNPEYFALQANGLRHFDTKAARPSSRYGHICFSSDIKKVIVDDADAFLNKKGARSRGLTHWSWSRYPDMPYFNIMPNDCCHPCQCAKCKPHFDKGPKAGSDFIWKFFVDIANEVKKRNIKGSLTTMAYANYREIPPFEIPDNLLIMLALRGPWNDLNPGAYKKDLAILKAWSEKIKGKTWLWTYPHKLYIEPGIPNYAPLAVGRFYKECAPHIFGAYMEAETDVYLFSAMNYYIYSRVAWNNNTDVKAVMDEYFTKMYGKAAPHMAKFSAILENKWLSCVGRSIETPEGPKTFFPSTVELWTKYYGEDFIKEVNTLFAKAEAAVKKDAESLKRVRFMRQELFGKILECREKWARTVSAKDHWYTIMPENKWSAPLYLLPLKDSKNNIAPPEVSTAVSMKRDKDNFYFKFECEEPFKNKVVAPARPRDYAKLWEDNTVEVHLDPTGEGKERFQFIVSSSGAVLDIKISKVVLDMKWNANCTAKVTPSKKGYTIELTIPRKDLPVAVPGKFKANFNRYRVVSGEKTIPYYTWSVFAKGFGDQENFGRIFFEKKSTPQLIKDGDFKKNPSSRFIGAWFSGAALVKDKGVFLHNGESLKLVNGQNLAQYVKFKPETEYILSFWVKLGADSSFNVRVDENNGFVRWLPTQKLQGPQQWIRQEFRFKTNKKPAGKKAYIRLQLFGKASTAWVSNVELYEAKK